MNTEDSEAWASTISYPWTLLAQLGLETLAFGVIAAFCLTQLTRGSWAWIGLLGGVAGALSSGAYLAAYGQIQWFENASIFDAVIGIDRNGFSISQTLSWLRVLAVVLVAVAFVVSRGVRRTPGID